MLLHIESKQQFDELIKEGRVLVDFFATWCGPCRMLAPMLEDLADSDQDLKILKVDVDQLPELAANYRVRSIPSLFFLLDGKIVNEGVGFMDLAKLQNFTKN